MRLQLLYQTDYAMELEQTAEQLHSVFIFRLWQLLLNGGNRGLSGRILQDREVVGE